MMLARSATGRMLLYRITCRMQLSGEELMNHRMCRIFCLLFAMTFLLATLAAQATRVAQPVLDIPKLGGITVDGNAQDWGDKGFRVVMTRTVNDTSSATDGFAPGYRLAWDDRGLLALFEVKDRYIADSAEAQKAGASDQINIVMGPWPEVNGTLGVQCGPKLSATAADARNAKYRTLQDATQTACSARADGYAVEVLIPWSSFGLSPKEGQEIAFSATATSIDSGGRRIQMSWNPRFDSGITLHGRLAKSTSPAILADFTSLEPQRTVQIAARLKTAPELIGWKLAIADGDRILARCTVTKGNDGLGEANATLPIARWGRIYDRLTIYAGTRQVGMTIPPPAVDLMPIKALETANLRFDPYVFSGTTFPRCDFEQRMFAESLIGPYTVTTTYYDTNGNEVKTAEKPGRYGAIVTVQPERGRAMQRYRTLYRMTQPIEWWNRSLDGSLKLPAEFGIDQTVADTQKEDVTEALKWALADACSRQEDTAILLAGLSEMKPTGQKAKPWENAQTRNRQWWLTLKRKLNGANTLYPEITSPRPLEGAPATVLHEGTLAEAGMKPDAADTIDDVCQRWAADSDQGFATLVARHGVVVLHKAYGTRDGRPMTLTDKSWMASITKLLGSNLLMMTVDQGLVDPDVPAATYLPALKDAGFNTSPTIRHFDVHMLGFPGDHWGDEMSDLEYVIADYAPYLRVGDVWMYNGVGYSLTGKISEMVSGKAIPVFYWKHLLEPLGCKNTDITGTYGDAMSTPWDIATIGQMMLNKGAYGNLRFYSEETFSKMQPQSMDKVYGRDTGRVWGLGMWGDGYLNYCGFAADNFGHYAASAATFVVDPSNDLVVVMTRNTTGKNFEKYQPQFFKAILDGIAK